MLFERARLQADLRADFASTCQGAQRRNLGFWIRTIDGSDASNRIFTPIVRLSAQVIPTPLDRRLLASGLVFALSPRLSAP